MLNSVKDFARGLKIIFGKPEPGEGDRSLARMSKVVMAQIPVYGKEAVRKQLSEGIWKDLNRFHKKGILDERLEIAIATPEYMLLLHKVGIEEKHLRAVAVQIKNGR